MEVLYLLSYGSIADMKVYIKMAPQVGLEPTTDRLTADSSTTELLRNNTYGGPKWTRTIDLTLIRRAL